MSTLNSEQQARSARSEIIGFSSGKGGTGKSLICACLGYALTRARHRVLMIDGDPGTDGLSLFLLGPKGLKQVSEFDLQNTFCGVILEFQESGKTEYEPRRINRRADDDHGVIYTSLISGRGLYGDVFSARDSLAVPDLTRDQFRKAVRSLFERLRTSGEFDYILVDTRGGFAFESTDICALSDSFMVVTEPDYTSFYQDRNLIRRISESAAEMGRKPLLRSIFVNKATEGIAASGKLDLDEVEKGFRNELTREFPVMFEDTHPVPFDLEAIRCYKTQQMPYVAAPSSLFSSSTLSAFGDILKVVTAGWTEEQIEAWNQLVSGVSQAIAVRSEAERTRRVQEDEKEKTAATDLTNAQTMTVSLQVENQRLKEELARLDAHSRREAENTRLFLQNVAPPSSPPPYASSQSVEALASAARPVWLRVVPISIVLAFIIMVAGGAFYFRHESTTTIVTKMYQTDLPPVVRLNYLKQALSKGVEDFSNLDFRGATFDRMDLSRVIFKGARLDQASFRGSNLKGSIFADATLTGADFTDAFMAGADFSGANLKGAKITGEQQLATITNGTTIFPETAVNVTGLKVAIHYEGNTAGDVAIANALARALDAAGWFTTTEYEASPVKPRVLYFSNQSPDAAIALQRTVLAVVPTLDYTKMPIQLDTHTNTYFGVWLPAANPMPTSGGQRVQ